MKNKRKERISIAVFAAALLMCIYGAFTGGADAVLMKAAKICMECIGLG